MTKLQAGSCIYLQGKSSVLHLHVVLTSPYGDPPQVVVVNFTDPQWDEDRTVVLNKGHAGIKKESIAYYRRAKIINVKEIEKDLNDIASRVAFHHEEPICTDELLQTLRNGLMKSKATPIKVKNFCAGLW